jgi:hypothetical protein
MKTCTKCGETKPTTAFYQWRKDCPSLRPRCRSCMSAWSAEYKRANPDYRRADTLQRKFGISLDEYDAMLKSQSGVCAICAKPCATGKRLAVDHNHKTGAVRGLLCSSCNIKLGWLEKYRPAVLSYPG